LSAYRRLRDSGPHDSSVVGCCPVSGASVRWLPGKRARIGRVRGAVCDEATLVLRRSESSSHERRIKPYLTYAKHTCDATYWIDFLAGHPYGGHP
jgi:hypothetical protein